MTRAFTGSLKRMIKCQHCEEKGIEPTKYYSQYDSSERKEVKIWECTKCGKPTLKEITK